MIEDAEVSLLTEAERILRERFLSSEDSKRRIPSDAAAAPGSRRVDQLVLPDELRGKMPFTKDKYLVKEDPHLVEWEREVRKFQRKMSPEHGHRITAVMVYEWATGIRLTDLMLEEEQDREQEREENDGYVKPTGRRGSWRADIRKLNRILEWYFGKPYMTWIMGRKVPKAYKIQPGYYIRRHRPMTLTLYAEYCEGSLYP